MSDGMLKKLQLPKLKDRAHLEQILKVQNVRLLTNREIPNDKFHELVYSEHGVIIIFHPKVTKLDEKGVLKKDEKGEPIFFDEAPFVGHFRHGTLSPIPFGTGEFFTEAPALVAA